MSTGRAAALAAVLTVLTAAGTGAAPAAAAPSPTYLLLTVKIAGGHEGRASLRCDPPRGTHPEAAEACTAVAAAKGDLRALTPRTGIMCTAQYQPATAAATGTWHGRPVRYRKTFSNSCALGVATGAVFAF